MRLLAGPLLAVACLLWLLASRFVLGRGWRVLPAIALTVAVVFSANEIRWHRFESALAQATAPVLAGSGHGFACERLTKGFLSSRGRVGHVRFGADGEPVGDAFLSSGTCAAVKAFRKDPSDADLDRVVAVHTVTHEAVHLSGERNEAVTECRAVQADEAVMVHLGATPQTARRAVQRYLAEVYPRLAPAYRTPGCRDGGPLDLSPGDGRWP